jgi:hypothetical protein
MIAYATAVAATHHRLAPARDSYRGRALAHQVTAKHSQYVSDGRIPH